MIEFATGEWVERLTGCGDNRFGRVIGRAAGDAEGYRLRLYNGLCVEDAVRTLRRACPADLTPAPADRS